MEIKLCIIFLLIGFILGIIVSAKLKINGTEISNHIDKIKGNNGSVTVDQTIPAEMTSEQKKEGLFKRIFKRKNKKT